jgi:hypothetical protein
MERLSFGHGFVPRIGRQNHRALDRAMGQPGLFGEEPFQIPWVIVDGAWIRPDAALLRQLRGLGVRILVDSQSWRFGDERTWDVAKYAALDHRPDGPLDPKAVDALVAFIKADLGWQLMLGADALLLPGSMPKKDDDAGSRTLTLAAEVAMTSELTKGKPIVGFLGAHSQSIDLINSMADDPMIALLSGVYVQISPVNPMADSVSKLIDVAEAMLRFERDGKPIVAGHLGAFGGVLRSLGISACDAGLGDGETFDAKRLLRRPDRKDRETSGGPSGMRRYVIQLLRSVDRKQWDILMSVDAIRGFLDCRLNCCRFRTMDDRTGRAREHSLRARVAEAVDLAELAPSMRASRQVDILQAARASLVTVNSALRSGGNQTLPVEPVENQLAALERIVASHKAA